MCLDIANTTLHIYIYIHIHRYCQNFHPTSPCPFVSTPMVGAAPEIGQDQCWSNACAAWLQQRGFGKKLAQRDLAAPGAVDWLDRSHWYRNVGP